VRQLGKWGNRILPLGALGQSECIVFERNSGVLANPTIEILNGNRVGNGANRYPFGPLASVVARFFPVLRDRSARESTDSGWDIPLPRACMQRDSRADAVM
jgi:hypothetical protein